MCWWRGGLVSTACHVRLRKKVQEGLGCEQAGHALEQEIGVSMPSRAGYDCAVIDGGAVDRDKGQGSQWSLKFCPIVSFLNLSMS